MPENSKYMVDSSGGIRQVPAAEVATKLNTGWLPASPEQIKQAERDERMNVGEAVAAGALAATRTATMGLSDLAYTESGLLDAEQITDVKEAYPVASGVGTAAGILVPLAVSGGSSALAQGAKGGVQAAARATMPAVANRLGRAVESKVAGALARDGLGLAERVAAKAVSAGAGNAVEGAFYGMGNVVSEYALGDPNLTAESAAAEVGFSALMGAGVGGALGAAGETLPAALGIAGRKVRSVKDYLVEKYPATAAKLTGHSEDKVRFLLENRHLKNAPEEWRKVEESFIRSMDDTTLADSQYIRAHDDLAPLAREELAATLPQERAHAAREELLAQAEDMLAAMRADPLNFEHYDYSKILKNIENYKNTTGPETASLQRRLAGLHERWMRDPAAYLDPEPLAQPADTLAQALSAVDELPVPQAADLAKKAEIRAAVEAERAAQARALDPSTKDAAQEAAIRAAKDAALQTSPQAIRAAKIAAMAAKYEKGSPPIIGKETAGRLAKEYAAAQAMPSSNVVEKITRDEALKSLEKRAAKEAFEEAKRLGLDLPGRGEASQTAVHLLKNPKDTALSAADANILRSEGAWAKEEPNYLFSAFKDTVKDLEALFRKAKKKASSGVGKGTARSDNNLASTSIADRAVALQEFLNKDMQRIRDATPEQWPTLEKEFKKFYADAEELMTPAGGKGGNVAEVREPVLKALRRMRDVEAPPKPAQAPAKAAREALEAPPAAPAPTPAPPQAVAQEAVQEALPPAPPMLHPKAAAALDRVEATRAALETATHQDLPALRKALREAAESLEAELPQHAAQLRKMDKLFGSAARAPAEILHKTTQLRNNLVDLLPEDGRLIRGSKENVYKKAKELADDLSRALHDPNRWGTAASGVERMETARVLLEKARKNLVDGEAKLLRPARHGYAVDVPKVRAFFKEFDTPAGERRRQALSNYLEAGARYADEFNATYSTLKPKDLNAEALKSLVSKTGDAAQQMRKQGLLEQYTKELAPEPGGLNAALLKPALGGYAFGGTGAALGALHGAYGLSKNVPAAVAALANLERAAKAVSNRMDNAVSTLVRHGVKAWKVGRGEAAAGLGSIFAKPYEKSEKSYSKHSAEMNRLAQDPQALADTLARQTGSLTQHAPDTALAMQQTTVRGVMYLASLARKMGAGGALAAEWRPSRTDIILYNRAAEVVENPEVVIKQAAAGTLTVEAVQALKAVYPTYHLELTRRIYWMLAELKTPPDLQTRNMLGMLLEQDLDGTSAPQVLLSNQAAYTMPDRKDNARPSQRSGVTVSDRALTATQQTEKEQP